MVGSSRISLGYASMRGDGIFSIFSLSVYRLLDEVVQL